MATNLIIARGGVGHVPPVSLAFWRWFTVFIILIPFFYRDIYKKKNIFKNYIHGNKVYPFIVNELNFDIDDIRDYKKVKKKINDK